MGLRTQSRQGRAQGHVFWTECHRLCGPHGAELCALCSGVLLMGYVGRDRAVLHMVHACAHRVPWAAYCKERGLHRDAVSTQSVRWCVCSGVW